MAATCENDRWHHLPGPDTQSARAAVHVDHTPSALCGGYSRKTISSIAPVISVSIVSNVSIEWQGIQFCDETRPSTREKNEFGVNIPGG